MPCRRCVLPRPALGALVAGLCAALVVAGCSTVSPTPVPSSATATADPTATPSPTPLPTPSFTNQPDATLSALIPAQVGEFVVEQPPISEYGLTPGDIGQAAYGELGNRFRSLVIAFVRSPRLSLYAIRVDPPEVRTEDLEPHLATAGRYVGIAGLQREPWELTAVADHWVWVRPSDGATLPGTRVYTWAAGEYVFLMIGVNDDLNQALLALLPSEPPPTPSPEPSASPGASEGAASPVPSGT